MSRATLLMFVVGLAMLGGMLYPAEFRKLAMVLVAPIMPEVFPKTLPWIYFFAQVLISTSILLLAGVPAALYERLWEGERASNVPMYIWLGCAFLLSVPALREVGVK